MKQSAEQNYQGRLDGCKMCVCVCVCLCVCVCVLECLYNCVRVLNNGIDVLLLSYDQEHFLCIKGLIAEMCAR